MSAPLTQNDLDTIQGQLQANITKTLALYGLTQDPTQQLTLVNQANDMSHLMLDLESISFHDLAVGVQAVLAPIQAANTQIQQVQATLANIGTYIGYAAQFISAVASLVKLLPVA